MSTLQRLVDFILRAIPSDTQRGITKEIVDQILKKKNEIKLAEKFLLLSEFYFIFFLLMQLCRKFLRRFFL